MVNVFTNESVGVSAVESAGVLFFNELNVFANFADSIVIDGVARFNVNSGHLKTQAGRVLDIQNTIIDVEFDRVDAGAGHDSAIRLSKIAGSFAISGNDEILPGGNGSGGSISGRTGIVVDIDSPVDVALANIDWSNNPSKTVLRLNEVTGLEIASSTFESNVAFSRFPTINATRASGNWVVKDSIFVANAGAYELLFKNSIHGQVSELLFEGNFYMGGTEVSQV